MSMFSLRTIIDDILLIVRNNNISESEDLSRAQIAAWVMHYKASLTKQQHDQEDNAGVDDYTESLTKTEGPLHLVFVEQHDPSCHTVRRTDKKIEDLFDDDPTYIVSITDEQGCPIQRMHSVRRHFHYFRKYTNRELTYNYENGYIYINGDMDDRRLRNIWIKYVGEDSSNGSEDDITVPEWMVPAIKELIFKNELAFMIKMPSDDDNNSTLDGIKPHGPQDQEK